MSAESPKPRIFISYRRDDSQGFARSIHDRLAQHFGPDAVFRDINDIEPGRPWAEAIDHALASCDVFVLLIGRRWLEATDDDGNRRLDDPEDRHRREIETAVNRRVRIFVALMEDAHMPRRKDLPQWSPDEEPTGLQLVPALHALRIADHAFDYGIEELVTNIERATEQPPRTQPVEQPPAPPGEPAGRREEPTAVPAPPPATRAPLAEPPGLGTPPTQEPQARPPGGGGWRRIGPAAAILAALVAAIAVGFVVLSGGGGDGGGGPEIAFEELTTDDYQLEVPTGWERIVDEEPIGGDTAHLQTRFLDPGGDILLGINHFPSDGLSPAEYVKQQEAQKLAEDGQYELHEMDEAVAPSGEPGAYWEFDADQPQLGGDEPSRIYAYVFDFGGTLYRIQCGAIVASGQDDVAEAVARQGVETLEVF